MSKTTLSSINTELEAILSVVEENSSGNLKTIVKRWILRKLIRSYIKWTLLVATLCFAVYFVPFLNWNASAIGRLVLIEFVLPFYKWEYLYNADCLINGWSKEIYLDEKRNTGNNDYNSNQSNQESCAICENLEMIDRITNTSYEELQNLYILRNRPVIISDSHDAWKNNFAKDDFLHFLQSMPLLMDSIPCNFVSNALQTQNNPFTLRKIIRQMEIIDSNTDDGWFLHFRNCEFEAIKATRAIVSIKKRPYYMSSHLPPFRSSWILMSHNCEMAAMKNLMVKDFVIVLQLRGEIAGRLVAQEACKGFCKGQEFQLRAGEALLFMASMWNFLYKPIADATDLKQTITFIQEIDQY